MNKLFLAAALAVVSIPAAATAQTPKAAPTIGDYVEAMRSTVGMVFEGGIQILAVDAEDNTLVITVTGPDGWRADAPPQQVSDALVTGFCETSPEFFRSSHITMRVDSIDMKAKTKGPVVTDCPSGGA